MVQARDDGKTMGGANKMNLRFERFGVSFYMGINRVVYVDGVNSHLPNGKHWLMWDFDDADPKEVITTLLEIQHRFKLPQVWVIPTGREGCYHANCFKSCTWEEAMGIIASTRLVDKKFLSIGILRGYFTLRYSPLPDRPFEQATILSSKVKEDVDPFSLTSFITYPKRRKHG